MKRDFWIERWEAGKIGFHRPKVHPMLATHWHRLGAEGGSKVLVPLCGKTLDMIWLAEQEIQVRGVELSAIAATDFFQENDLSVAHSVEEPFKVQASGDIEILIGDVFHLEPEHVADISAIYDRAALVALPPEMRKAYTDHLKTVFDTNVSILLITLEYPLHEMDGPPFSVSDKQVHVLFEDRFSIALLEEEDVLSSHVPFMERGMTRLIERVYLLTG